MTHTILLLFAILLHTAGHFRVSRIDMTVNLTLSTTNTEGCLPQWGPCLPRLHQGK